MWYPLKDLKESHPVQVAEYDAATGVADKPAFSWWGAYVIKKRDSYFETAGGSKLAGIEQFEPLRLNQLLS